MVKPISPIASLKEEVAQAQSLLTTLEQRQDFFSWLVFKGKLISVSQQLNSTNNANQVLYTVPATSYFFLVAGGASCGKGNNNPFPEAVVALRIVPSGSPQGLTDLFMVTQTIDAAAGNSESGNFSIPLIIPPSTSVAMLVQSCTTSAVWFAGYEVPIALLKTIGINV